MKVSVDSLGENKWRKSSEMDRITLETLKKEGDSVK